MHGQYGLPSPDVRSRDHHLAVEPAGTEQGGVENVGAVGGRHDYYAFVSLESVHFHQQLVERLLPFVVTSSESRSPVPSHGVELVDENYARGVFLRLYEQVPYPGRPDAHEHLHEIASADDEKRHFRLSRYRLGQKGLARSRGTDQQDSLGYPSPEPGDFLGVFKKLHYLAHFLLGLLNAGHVLESDLVLAFRQHAGAVFPEAHGLCASRLHLPHEKDHEGDQYEKRTPVYEHLGEGALAFAGEAELHAAFLELGDEYLAHGTGGGETLLGGIGVFELSLYHVFPELELVYPVVVQMVEKTAVGYLRVDVARGVHELVDGEHPDEYRRPQHEVFKYASGHFNVPRRGRP